MFDFSTVKDQAIAKKVYDEASDFMAHCHYGSQGVAKTEKDVADAVRYMMSTGFKPIAFDTEMPFIPMVKDIMQGYTRTHCAVSYPMGRTTLATKLNTLRKLKEMGVDDVCVCLDWEALFSGNYKAIEEEASIIMKEFLGHFYRTALILPATLMSDTALIEVCKALDQAGVVSIKVNPGAKLGVSFEEVSLIKRNFPNRFDIHPSGNIRSLSDVLRYREMGCDNIHTVKSMELVDEYIVKKLKQYGGIN